MSGWWDDQLAGCAPARSPAVGASRPVARAAPQSSQPPPGDRPDVSHRDEWAQWWGYALASARRCLDGVTPPCLEVYGPVLDADEAGLLSATVTYARLYGGDGRYRRSDLLVVGRPAVMAAGLALNAVITHRRKAIARRDAVPRWRDHQPVPVIATTHRLLCDTDRGWESFWYATVTEFYPDLHGWSLTLGFGSQGTAMRLSGPAAPALCLWAARAVLGEGWVTDPRLDGLLR